MQFIASCKKRIIGDAFVNVGHKLFIYAYTHLEWKLKLRHVYRLPISTCNNLFRSYIFIDNKLIVLAKSVCAYILSYTSGFQSISNSSLYDILILKYGKMNLVGSTQKTLWVIRANYFSIYNSWLHTDKVLKQLEAR